MIVTYSIAVRRTRTMPTNPSGVDIKQVVSRMVQREIGRLVSVEQAEGGDNKKMSERALEVLNAGRRRRLLPSQSGGIFWDASGKSRAKLSWAWRGIWGIEVGTSIAMD